MVRFAIDGQGDIALYANLPAEELHYEIFARVMDLMTATTSAFAPALARMVADDSVSPPELSGMLK